MKYFYYIGEGPENDALVSKVLAEHDTVSERRKALMAEYDADFLILDSWRNGVPVGLGFYERQRRPYLKGEVFHDGSYAYYPKISTKMGRDLKEKLGNPDLVFSVRKRILGELKLHRMLFSGRIIAGSTAGIEGNTILVKIPADTDGATGDPMPEVPSWLKEVKMSEWLAAQGK